MRFIILIITGLLMISCRNSHIETINSLADYPIIPKPKILEIKKGRFVLLSATQLNASSELINEANYLRDMLNQVADISVNIAEEYTLKGNITLRLVPEILNKEDYKLSISQQSIIISANSPAGIFYGIQSLRQLLPPEIESKSKDHLAITIPAVEIEDGPRYAYRGMHLDVGRHFFDSSYIKRYLDLIAMHKMNTFHWHLTEDQGWRIEIKKYPKLTSIGAYRDGTAIGLAGTKNAPYTYDTIRYGGYYTQEQIREVLDYAAKRHIVVIPEIELPGHSSAALAAYPEFGNNQGPYEVAKRWGIFTEIYSPKEETFTFLEEILTEVMELFPSKYIHIGGDEVLKKEWEESPYAQELIKRENLGDEKGLQSYFIRRIESFLNSFDREIIGWDEILEGGLAPNAVVMSWRGEEGGIEAAKQHHKVIMTPGTHCYFDYYQIDGEEQKNEPLTGSSRVTTVEKVYYYEPTPEILSETEKKYILGAQGNVWTEYMPTFEHVEYMVLPRMTALSEVLWSNKERRDWDDFQMRLQTMTQRFDAIGYRYAKHSLKMD
ncbi:beta-N-acetylhexosaminidase [Namhaeicola litoreus]|uniref:beta-N-acetylhexosaminidase n=1 Tax=Namhaeicola litoreus TaxID=1052145 RepID=A0ABW3XWW8_9FLAO